MKIRKEQHKYMNAKNIIEQKQIQITKIILKIQHKEEKYEDQPKYHYIKFSGDIMNGPHKKSSSTDTLKQKNFLSRFSANIFLHFSLGRIEESSLQHSSLPSLSMPASKQQLEEEKEL
jgi:hypothetical protein